MTSTGQAIAAGRSNSTFLRDYRLLLTGYIVSAAGDWLYKLALPLLVLRLTGSALQAAVIYSLEYAPYLLFAPIGGVIADRYDRRRVLIVANTLATVVAGLMTGLVWAHQYHLWLIYLVAFSLSMITPLYQATFLGMMPGIVPGEKLGWANSRLQGGQSLLDMAGPLIGVGAVVALGVNWALTLDAISFGLSAVTITALRYRHPPDRPGQHSGMVAELREAARFVRVTPAMLWGSVVSAGSSLGLAMVEGNMLAYLVRFRHLPVADVGLVFAALGLGAFAGALLAPRLIARVYSGRLVIACALVGGSATALLAFLQPVALIAAAWVVVGASTAVFTVTFYTLRHQLTPGHMLGRVVVVTRMIGFSMLPIAPVIGGAILSGAGAFWPVIAVAAGVQVAAGAGALLSPLRTPPAASAPPGA
ncbi:MAG TPA: MFS transporter [Trebonia sp.]|jgi:MFS family permease|nr:MFS transporter [Trebonia sp.]